MIEREGVIKCFLEFTDGVVAETASLGVLNAWSSILKDPEVVGEDPDRNGSYGFGNLSIRTDRGFLLTGSQTRSLNMTSMSR